MVADWLTKFAEGVKFKTSKDNTYTFFNINKEKQIRIYRTNKTSANTIKYHVTLHTVDSYCSLTYKPYERNEPALTLKEAKLIAAKYYYSIMDNIREYENTLESEKQIYFDLNGYYPKEVKTFDQWVKQIAK